MKKLNLNILFHHIISKLICFRFFSSYSECSYPVVQRAYLKPSLILRKGLWSSHCSFVYNFSEASLAKRHFSKSSFYHEGKKEEKPNRGWRWMNQLSIIQIEKWKQEERWGGWRRRIKVKVGFKRTIGYLQDSKDPHFYPWPCVVEVPGIRF